MMYASPFENSVPDEILHQSLAWLQPDDVARASQVCKAWRNLEQSIPQHVWKKTAENIQPEAVHVLERAMNGNSSEQMMTMTSKTMAINLAKLAAMRRPPPPITGPTIQAEDIFILVEIQAFGVKDAWCKSLGDSVENTEWRRQEFASVQWYDEPSHASFRIPEERFEDVRILPDLGKDVTMTTSLWRRDTGQVFNLCADQPIFDYGYFNGNRAWDATGICFCCDNPVQPTANSRMGDAARSMCLQKEYNFLDPDVNIRLEKVDDDGMYRVSALLMELRFSVGSDECANGNVDSPKELLMFLEAIDWK